MAGVGDDGVASVEDDSWCWRWKWLMLKIAVAGVEDGSGWF